jgi:cytosine/adenosine deaminase-related metal-dependent hydrolase
VTRFSAEWVLPISDPPISGGVVAIDDGLIVAVGGRESGEDVALGRVALLPGLVNAHTHLELSYLQNRIPPAERFLDWVRRMLAARRERTTADDPEIVRDAKEAIQHARDAGTALIGDVTNTLATVPLLRDAAMPACVFHELIGFSGIKADEQVAGARRVLDELPSDENLRLSLAPHAPYSVSPALFAAIRRDLDGHGSAISTVHLGESPDEVELLETGGGAWRTLLQDLGVWDPGWQAPRCSAVDYLADMGFIDRSVLAVHGVQLDGKDLDRLRALGTTLVSCPRSNRHVGVGSPPLEAFYAMKVAVAFGTDSLASVADLNLFAELAEARRIAPKVPARALLRSATLTGATALGFGSQLGSIEPGKQASLIAVRVPDGISDVEEYLVSGVEPSAIRWLAPSPDSRHPTPNQ